MTEQRHFVTPTPSTHNQVRSKENQVKVNFTFDVPLNDDLKEKIGENNCSAGKIAGRLNKLIGTALADIAIQDNPYYEGKFVVTETKNNIICGEYISHSMISVTTEIKLLEKLRQSLKDLAHTSAIHAEINLDCYF